MKKTNTKNSATEGIVLEVETSKQVIAKKGGVVHLLAKVNVPTAKRGRGKKPVALTLIIDNSGSMGSAAFAFDGAPVNINQPWVAPQPWPQPAPVVPQPNQPYVQPFPQGGHPQPWVNPQPQPWVAPGNPFPPFVPVAPQAPVNFPSFTLAHPLNKLELVKQAAQKLINSMPDGDAVSVVVFSSSVHVLFPLTELNAHTRNLIGAQIASVQLSGSTYLEGGLLQGIEQFTQNFSKNFSCKAVLLSDGEANIGETNPQVLARHAKAATKNGLSISTLGVGVGYNSALMAALADAGNGDFYHLESLEMLDTIFQEEFLAAATVLAKDTTLRINVPNQVAVSENLNKYPQETVKDAIEIQLGDLSRSKEVLLELTTPLALKQTTISVSVELVGTDADKKSFSLIQEVEFKVVTEAKAKAAPENTEVVNKVVELMKAHAIYFATTYYDAGDIANATVSLSGTRSAMVGSTAYYSQEALAAAGFDEANASLTNTEESMKHRLLGASESKAMFYTSNNSRRTKST